MTGRRQIYFLFNNHQVLSLSFIVFTIFRLQMCQCIEKVVQLAIATFSKKTPQETAKKNLDLLIAQTNKLTNVDVGLEHCSVFDSSPPRDSRAATPAPVTYIPVVENKHISMGIFVIREGQHIPLHDHPNMHGVIKCIAGKLNITSFSKLVRITLADTFLVVIPDNSSGQDCSNSGEVQTLSKSAGEDKVRPTLPCRERQHSHD